MIFSKPTESDLSGNGVIPPTCGTQIIRKLVMVSNTVTSQWTEWGILFSGKPKWRYSRIISPVVGWWVKNTWLSILFFWRQGTKVHCSGTGGVKHATRLRQPGTDAGLESPSTRLKCLGGNEHLREELWPMARYWRSKIDLTWMGGSKNTKKEVWLV